MDGQKDFKMDPCMEWHTDPICAYAEVKSYSTLKITVPLDIRMVIAVIIRYSFTTPL